MTLYVVGAVKKTHAVTSMGLETDLKLVWADGMIGVLPVFSDLDKAREYAGKEYQIFKITVEEV